MSLAFEHADKVAAKFRGLRMLSALNHKTPRGEAAGYLQAILYMAPHTLAGGKSVCPHSSPVCREGCLFSAGRGRTPKVIGARLRRTRMYLHDRDAFFDELIGELVQMQRGADDHGLRLAIRLNGTSDILWERETLDGGQTIFDLFPPASMFDYTRAPIRHRKVPENWHLVWSLADGDIAEARAHLLAGQSVAAVVPFDDKGAAPARIAIDDRIVPVVDGDTHDLRFTDPPGALVLLGPKGRLLRGGPMVRANLIDQLRRST